MGKVSGAERMTFRCREKEEANVQRLESVLWVQGKMGGPVRL